MKKMKMKAMAAVLTGCMVLGLAACGSGDTSSAGAAAEATDTADSDLKEIDVVLDWYPNVIHTFLYDAVDKGYFEEEGLKVNLIPPAESVDALNFVASGKAQIGISYPVDIINGDVNSDMNVRAIGAVSQDTLSVLCALKDSGIDTEDMSTLKGKKIGYSGEESAKMEAISVAKAGGLSEDDYELVNVGFDLVTSLTTGSVDMIVGGMINDEVITMQNAGYDLETWDSSAFGVPSAEGMVFVANDDEYQKDPETYNAFLRACKKGFDDIKNDEDAALEIVMNEMNTEDNPLDEDQQRQSYEVLMPRMETEDGNFLTMQDDVWQSYIDWMYDQGLIEEKCEPSDVMTAPQF